MPRSTAKLHIVDSMGAIASGTAATREPSRKCVSAVPASVGLSQGPSAAFIRRSRNPDLDSPARFVPTVKSKGDIVL